MHILHASQNFVKIHPLPFN